MPDEKTPPPGDTGESKDTTPPPGDTGDRDKGITIPKARLDQEITKRRALEAELEALAKELEADVPEEYRDLIPTSLSASERVKWLRAASAKGLFSSPEPPSTHQSKPRLVKPAPNPDAMSPTQKMAAGYGRGKKE